MDAGEERERLALFLPSLGGGGAERVMVTLANGFARRGHPVDLVLARAEGPFLSDVVEEINLVDLEVGRTAAALPGLVQYLRDYRPAALLSTLNHANLIAIIAHRLAGSKARLVVREANTTSFSTGEGAPLRGRLVPWLMRGLYRFAHQVVAVSGGVGDDLVEAGIAAPGQVEVIYNPSITEEGKALARESVEHPYFERGFEVILAVGSLTRQKDYPTLIDAFERIAESRDEARLVVLGEGEERPVLEAMIASRGLSERVDLAGFVDNPFSYMAKCDVFVLSSAWEGLPNTLIQALGVGATAVATDCPSGPREILDGGRWGPLVEVGDSPGLAKALEEVLDGRWIEPDGREEHLQQFREEAVVQRYLEVMNHQ